LYTARLRFDEIFLVEKPGFRFNLNRHVTVFIFLELNFSSSYISCFKNNKVVCNIFCNLRFDEIFLVEKPGDGFISVSGLI